MNTLSQTIHTLIDRTLQALSAFFPGKQDTIQQQQLQLMFDHRILSHRDMIIDPRIYTLIPPSQSHQDEAQAPNPYQQHHEWLEQKRRQNKALDAEFEQLITQGCTTEDITPNRTQKEMIRKSSAPLFRKTTFQPMVVVEDVFLNDLPITSESLPIFDPEETHKVPAIMKLRHGA